MSSSEYTTNWSAESSRISDADKVVNGVIHLSMKHGALHRARVNEPSRRTPESKVLLSPYNKNKRSKKKKKTVIERSGHPQTRVRTPNRQASNKDRTSISLSPGKTRQGSAPGAVSQGAEQLYSCHFVSGDQYHYSFHGAQGSLVPIDFCFGGAPHAQNDVWISPSWHEIPKQAHNPCDKETEATISKLKWPFDNVLIDSETERGGGGGGGSQPSTTGSHGFPQFVTAGPDTSLFGHNLFGDDREDLLDGIAWS